MKHPLLAASIVGLALGTPAWGQARPGAERFERQLEQIYRETRLRARPEVPAEQRAIIDYGGYLAFNFFAVDDIYQSTHILREYDLIGYARVNIDNAHEFFFRGRTSYRDFNSGDSFDDNGDDHIGPQLEQAYYRFDLARHLAAYEGRNIENNLTIQAGRQFVFWANGLVLAQTLDGAIANFKVGNVSLEVLGGQTWQQTIDFDSSRPDFEDDTLRVFYGAMLSVQCGRHRPFIYGLVQRDNNSEGPFNVATVPTRFEYNSWYIGGGVNGSITDRLLYTLEAVYEGGDTLSNSFDTNTFEPIDQEKDDISAAAMDFRLDYLFADAQRSRLTFETLLATGDDDRLGTSTTFGGNAPSTTDGAFNGFGLLNTGLAFGSNLSNLTILRLGGSTFPFAASTGLRRFQVGSDLLLLGKFRSDGALDEPSYNEWFVGFEPDVYLNWQITSDLTLALRYGVFFPGPAIVNDEHPRHFFYMGMTFSF